MATFLYRVNGGKVENSSINPASYDGLKANPIEGSFWETVTDPPLPDGADLAIAKIFDAGTVRNATPAEISTFANAEATDNNLIARRYAEEAIDDGAIERKKLRAVVGVLVDELNILRQWLMAFQVGTEGSNNLSAFKTMVSGLPSLPDRDLDAAKTTYRNRISSGGVD